ncbi:hypothetical protein SDC9_159756 [bioreactor metagenome]|uniref:Uncharacterized protein n=1 Tax=bioreactor metagenome TaxID=1076179 RepID=A0A645FDF5_9ZZZZ
MPFGPKASVREMLLVNGGEISGSMVTAPNRAFSILGRLVRVTARANRYPRKVPVMLTAVARIKLPYSALMLYPVPNTFFILVKEKTPSTMKVVSKRRIRGRNIKTANESQTVTRAKKSAGSVFESDLRFIEPCMRYSFSAYRRRGLMEGPS